MSIEDQCFIRGRNPSIENPAQWVTYDIRVPASQLEGTALRYCYFAKFKPGVAAVGAQATVIGPANSGTSLDVDVQSWVWDYDTDAPVSGSAVNVLANLDGLTANSRLFTFTGGGIGQIYQKISGGPASLSVGDPWVDPYGGTLALAITPAGTNSTDELRVLVNVLMARVNGEG